MLENKFHTKNIIIRHLVLSKTNRYISRLAYISFNIELLNVCLLLLIKKISRAISVIHVSYLFQKCGYHELKILQIGLNSLKHVSYHLDCMYLIHFLMDLMFHNSRCRKRLDLRVHTNNIYIHYIIYNIDFFI